MLKRTLKYAGIFFLAVFVIINLIMGYYGVSSIFLTAIVYTFLWVAGAICFSRLFKKTEYQRRCIVLTTSLIGSLFLGEVALKYVFKMNLSRQEINGSLFYSFPYGKPEVENLFRRLGHKEPDLRLSNYVPYMQEIKSCDEFEYLHRYNSLGLRGREPSRDAAKINIVGLGDSFTEGNGTPEDSTWLQLLENSLNENVLRLPEKVQCINGGISGNEPIAEYIILKELLLPLKPRIVMLAINNTDITDVVQLGGWERFSNHRKVPWYAYIYQFSFIARAIIHVVHPVNWLFLTDEEYREEEKRALEIIHQCIVTDYVKLSQEHCFKLIVVLHPILFELEQDYFPLQPLVHNLESNYDIKTINLFEEFKQAKLQYGFEYKSLYWLKDGHNNSRGYRLWADILVPEIELTLKDAPCF